MYLFDTDTISNVLKKRPSELLLSKLESITKELQFTTSINISEIYYGAYKSEYKEQILFAFNEKVIPNIGSGTGIPKIPPGPPKRSLE